MARSAVRHRSYVPRARTRSDLGEALLQAGFEPGPATVLMMSVGRFVVGWVLEEQSAQAPDAPPSSLLAGPDASQYPLLAQGWKQTVGGDPDELFERALRLLIDGARP